MILWKQQIDRPGGVMSKASIKFEDGKLVAGLDMNEDGQNSISIKMSMNEALQEGMAALKKGEKKEVTVEAKAVKLVFVDGKIAVSVDTDRDGEELLSVAVDMTESVEEIASAVFGK